MLDAVYNIRSLSLTNFNIFIKDIHAHFHKKITIIKSPNRECKTAIVNTIRAGMWPYSGKFSFENDSGECLNV